MNHFSKSPINPLFADYFPPGTPLLSQDELRSIEEQMRAVAAGRCAACPLQGPSKATAQPIFGAKIAPSPLHQPERGL
jgi:hypothetical protein